MLRELLLRFLIGGSIVSAFALISDSFSPKRFAGLFSAAPSVALATLVLTTAKDGKSYAALEARSMMAGSVAFVVYAAAVFFVLTKWKLHVLKASILLLPLWIAVAFGYWGAFLR